LPIHKLHIKQLALFYLICFGLNQCWSVFHGLYFVAVQPIFFLNKLDLTGNLLMSTGFQQLIMNHTLVRWVLDIGFMSMPFALYMAVIKEWKIQKAIAIFTALFVMLYGYFFSMMSSMSIEMYIAWMLFPLLFSGKTVDAFYYRLHILRYLFVLFFFSTALWKIRAGGIFNPEQFSAILLQQHLPVLVSAPQYWFSELIHWVLNHPHVSFTLYLLATAIEFVFVIGFFTKKYDRILAVLLCCFLVMDYFLMEINYFPWLPFLGCLYFSRYKLSDS